MFVSGPSRKYLSQEAGFQAMHRGEEGIDFMWNARYEEVLGESKELKPRTRTTINDDSF
jgi:hypothetical protein